jgi:hypothetical protein
MTFPSTYKILSSWNWAIFRVSLFTLHTVRVGNIFAVTGPYQRVFLWMWLPPLIILPLDCWWSNIIKAFLFMYCSNTPLFPFFKRGGLLLGYSPSLFLLVPWCPYWPSPIQASKSCAASINSLTDLNRKAINPCLNSYHKSSLSFSIICSSVGT